LTSTSSQTFTSTPSETASPTNPLVTPIYTYVYRSPTPIPTTQPPGGPAPTVTRTFAPQPSNTPIKATEVPPTIEITPTLPPVTTPTLPPT
jgi:hypothetical protein